MSDEIVRVEIVDRIGLICLAKPPVNALGVALRSGVYDATLRMIHNPDVAAILLYGEGKFFSAGADIKDFGRAGEKPTLPDLLKTLNDCPKPVIAALHGIAFGGALELALAAHVRVGVTGVKVGLPEVKLGLLPGAGGTQRLPRLTGLQAAIDIVTTGREVSGAEAVDLGILSRIEDGTAREVGLRAAHDVLSRRLEATPTDSLMVTRDPEALEAGRAKFTKRRPQLKAPLAAIDALAASTMPIQDGLARERALFMELMESDERAGLVHAFLAERATGKIPEQDAVPREIGNVGIVGGGTMGVGIATAFLLAGFPVRLIEGQAERVDQARGAVEKNLEGALKRGKLSDADHEAALTRFTCSADIGDLWDASLVVEAIFEDMDAKKALFEKLDVLCKPDTILATNTSYLDINEIAAVTSRPEDMIGLHFFSPAHIMRLLEVVVAEKTAPELVATSFALARKLKKVPVRAGVCDGFIGNRILTQYRKATEYLLLDGADFEQIDQALEDFGFALGPFAVSDLAGLDIARANRQRKAATRPAEERYSRVSDLLCEAGWFGRKTGRGYYLYEDPKKRTPNPDALEIVENERAALGIKPRRFTDQDIVLRCLTAMIVEAVNVLEAGIALRPVDIDAVELFGYGFPRHQGGPMLIADQIGLETLIARIEDYAREDPYFWKVPMMLHQMKRKGQSFADLNNRTFA